MQLGKACFNSTMVRLKALAWDEMNKREISFNSTMVRLKAWPPSFSDDRRGCFNSTMVRLKAKAAAETAQGAWAFQFHYGSIKGFICSA